MAVAGRRWLAPEVVQTSAMDCGPAALKCLLEGHGVPVSYGRLREACQTSVDGTSIDTLEEVANQLGLVAEQVMIPADHLLLPGPRSLPALVVVRRPDGMTHFVVVWRLHGAWVQLMDPVSGRRWLRGRQLLRELYQHRLLVAAADWRDWAGSEDFMMALRQRLTRLGVDRATGRHLLQQAQADPDWHGLAWLDAAIRMTGALLQAGGLRRGVEAQRLLVSLCQPAAGDADARDGIPPVYWSVQAAPDDADEPQLLLQGVVLIRVAGRQPEPVPEGTRLPPELDAALTDAVPRPERELIDLLRLDGLAGPAVIVAAVGLGALAVLVEALLFRGLLSLVEGPFAGGVRLSMLAAAGVFLVLMLLLDYPLAMAEALLGRRLENRLRMRFMAKLPRLPERYFSSRLTSDMAHRAHQIRELRELPRSALLLLRTGGEMALTTAGLIWLYPGGAPIAVLGLLVTVGLWLAAQPLLFAKDMNLRTHEGALNRFYLDALLGLTTIRTHVAESAVRREHEGLLVHWVRAGRGFYDAHALVQTLAALAGMGVAVWLVYSYLSHGGAVAGILLLVYWALRLPALGRVLARVLQQYPMQRNRLLRLLEPLTAPEDEAVTVTVASPAMKSADAVSYGVGLEFEDVEVRAGGHPVLLGVHLSVGAGEQVAIVGSSGAGKSTLVGLLLGWQRPSRGVVRINGVPLDGNGLRRLRQETAWVDPAVQIWNRSLRDNLLYGNHSGDVDLLNTVVDQAGLLQVLQRLPEGLRTLLGEGGGLVSGGQGQRVRLGRAMLRREARLVILDEPFRGLDRTQRRLLLARVRDYWQGATLLFVSHDVGDTEDFERVVVIDGGAIIEDDTPATLLATTSRYRVLVDAERQVRDTFWKAAGWRRFNLSDGKLRESCSTTVPGE